jgi:hypothetical protein
MSQSEPPREQRPLSIGAGAVVIHDGRMLLVRNLHGVTRGATTPGVSTFPVSR